MVDMNEHIVWENLPVERRNALVARILGWEPSTGDDAPSPYIDGAIAVRLIEHLARERRVSALRVQFDMWPDAWPLFLETTIAGATDEIHVVGDTFQDAIAKGALTLHDVDFDRLYVDKEGTPSEQRALNALIEPVSRVLARALLRETHHDVLVAYRRVAPTTPVSRAELASLLVHELHRMATEGDTTT